MGQTYHELALEHSDTVDLHMFEDVFGHEDAVSFVEA